MSATNDLGHLRKSYNKNELTDNDRDRIPFELFADWFKDAEEHSDIEEANAMSLSTLGEDGFPKARVVLLKSYSEEGFVFFTNFQSLKGRSIAVHPQVGLSFWPSLERQIHISGYATKVPDKVSDAYFDSRPLGSRLGAMASEQSQPVKNRAEIEEELLALESAYQTHSPKRPSHWGGYLVRPITFEFWQGRPNRLHDRLFFSQTTKNDWICQRLAP